VLAGANMMELLAHKLASLRRRRLALTPVLFRSFQSLFVRHDFVLLKKVVPR
jgi:hypothetical protein